MKTYSAKPGEITREWYLVDAEPREHAMHDRRRRLGGAGSGELALGREGDPADACAAVAGGLTDEHNRCMTAHTEVRAEAFLEQC